VGLQAKVSIDDTGPRISSRRISDEDLPALAAFLGDGLNYPAAYYLTVLARLKAHATPEGFPKYGYVLTDGANIVGALLQIYSTVPGTERPYVRCHMASWCVKEEYRAFAGLFYRKALSAKDVTFLNTSARPVAIPSIIAQGFQSYSNGQFASVPVLHAIGAGGSRGVRVVDARLDPQVPFDPAEAQVLADHASYGCICVWCVTAERAYPFVFHKRAFKGVLPGAQLVYCPSLASFARFAGPLGRFLAKQGVYIVRMDADGPIQGLAGWYLDKMERRYFKGVRPRLGDLAYTQAVLTKSLRRDAPLSG
jgi:hypothetical protein